MAIQEANLTETRWLTPDELETWRAFNCLLARIPTRLSAGIQSDADLSYLEYYVLSSLSDAPQYTRRLSELAGLAHSELSRLSHLIKRLEARGFVRREADPTDGRFTNAILTDAGFEQLRLAAPGHVQQIRSLVFDALTCEEQHALRAAAKKIAAQLDDEGCCDGPAS